MLFNLTYKMRLSDCKRYDSVFTPYLEYYLDCYFALLGKTLALFQVREESDQILEIVGNLMVTSQ